MQDSHGGASILGGCPAGTGAASFSQLPAQPLWLLDTGFSRLLPTLSRSRPSTEVARKRSKSHVRICPPLKVPLPRGWTPSGAVVGEYQPPSISTPDVKGSPYPPVLELSPGFKISLSGCLVSRKAQESVINKCDRKIIPGL